MEIPTTIKYDFLLVVFGIAITYEVFSFEIYKVSMIAFALSFYIGVVLIFYGISLIKYDYEMDMELKELETAKQINEYIIYFEGKKLLTDANKKTLLKDIKDYVKQDD